MTIVNSGNAIEAAQAAAAKVKASPAPAEVFLSNAVEAAGAAAAKVKAQSLPEKPAGSLGYPVPAPKPECGWATVYHPSGLQVKLPVGEHPLDYAGMLANVSAMLGAGWLVAAPGLEVGENRDVCGWVVRSQKDGRTGTAEVLDLYLPDDIFAKVRMYLNSPDDISAFEAVSGLVVAKLPLYIGDNKIERGKAKQTDALFTRAPRPFGFVWKHNPAHDPDETDATKKKPKRVFVRWADTPVKTQPAVAADEIPLKDAIAGRFRAARSHSDYLRVCDEIKIAYGEKKLSEEDRLWLRGHAAACLDRCPAPVAARA